MGARVPVSVRAGRVIVRAHVCCRDGCECACARVVRVCACARLCVCPCVQVLVWFGAGVCAHVFCAYVHASVFACVCMDSSWGLCVYVYFVHVYLCECALRRHMCASDVLLSCMCVHTGLFTHLLIHAGLCV